MKWPPEPCHPTSSTAAVSCENGVDETQRWEKAEGKDPSKLSSWLMKLNSVKPDLPKLGLLCYADSLLPLFAILTQATQYIQSNTMTS